MTDPDPAQLELHLEGDPALLADLAKRRLRAKIPELTEALTGRFSDHHGFLARGRNAARVGWL